MKKFLTIILSIIFLQTQVYSFPIAQTSIFQNIKTTITQKQNSNIKIDKKFFLKKDAFTQEELTKAERILTAMGLLIGTGAMWRSFADSISTQATKSGLKDVDSIIDTIKKDYSSTIDSKIATKQATVSSKETTNTINTASNFEKSGNVRNVGKVEKTGSNVAKQTGKIPENMSPSGAGRHGALNEAKCQNNISTSQSPEYQEQNIDRRGNKQPGRKYQYRDSNGNLVEIRDDAAGHIYSDNPSQNRGQHFNDEKGNHYDY